MKSGACSGCMPQLCFTFSISLGGGQISFYCRQGTGRPKKVHNHLLSPSLSKAPDERVHRQNNITPLFKKKLDKNSMLPFKRSTSCKENEAMV